MMSVCRVHVTPEQFHKLRLLAMLEGLAHPSDIIKSARGLFALLALDGRLSDPSAALSIGTPAAPTFEIIVGDPPEQNKTQTAT